MDSSPIMRTFPHQRRVAKEYEGKVRSLNGQAPEGFWNYKLEFGTEVVSLNPHHAVETLADEVFGSSTQIGDFDFESEPRVMERVSTKKRAFDLSKLERSVMLPLLWSGDCFISSLVLDASVENPVRTPRFCHHDSDTLFFVHEGKGTAVTSLGYLNFKAGDFVYIPRGAIYKLESVCNVKIVMYEFSRRLFTPNHYWLNGYPFSDTALVPAQPTIDVKDDPDSPSQWKVYAKYKTGLWATLSYPFSPLDAVCWEGTIYPFTLNIQDIRTFSSPDFHIDPTALTVFVSEDGGASLQLFKPRWVHSLPYPHQNYMDEVLFNHSGYSARAEIGDGSMTLHPAGIFHGPDLNKLIERGDMAWADEVGVMVESRSSFSVLHDAAAVEVNGYGTSAYRQYLNMMDKDDSKKSRKGSPSSRRRGTSDGQSR